MTLTLELPPEVEGALTEEARQKGTTPEILILEDIRHRYATGISSPATVRNSGNAMVALFAQWEAEYATTVPAELARRQQEGDELIASLAVNRINFQGRTDFTDLL